MDISLITQNSRRSLTRKGSFYFYFLGIRTAGRRGGKRLSAPTTSPRMGSRPALSPAAEMNCSWSGSRLRSSSVALRMRSGSPKAPAGTMGNGSTRDLSSSSSPSSSKENVRGLLWSSCLQVCIFRALDSHFNSRCCQTLPENPTGSGRSRSPLGAEVAEVVVVDVLAVVVAVVASAWDGGRRVAKTGSGSEGLNGTGALVVVSFIMNAFVSLSNIPQRRR